ncbi:MAG: DUF1538 domain-containing protein [Kiritimatiellia bacterium]|jgi:hypothetical protein
MLKILAKDFLEVLKSTGPLLIAIITLKLLLKSPFDSIRQFTAGLVFVLVGLFIFLKGVDMCLIPMATDVGGALVKLPTRGLIILVCFAIGFTATLVEPALQVIAKQAEEITVGALKGNVLIYATAVGCALGMALGIAKVLYNLKTVYFVVPMIVVLFILAFFAEDLIVGLAWDCASALTGPVNIPINSAIALGLAANVAGVDPMRVGFGLVGLTSLGAAASVMLASILKI